MITIDHLDHLVLTVADLERSCHFYTEILGMRVETFGEGRKALVFGNQKINLHKAGEEFEPKASRPTPGSGDLCFIAAGPLTQVIEFLRRSGVSLEQGPIRRTGATGPILSVYIRDPDDNLIEIAEPVREA